MTLYLSFDNLVHTRLLKNITLSSIWKVFDIRISNFSESKMAKYTIVMVRHGESEWNQKNLFCGWYDANLSPKGKVKT